MDVLKINKNIFLVLFSNYYDMGMTFLRQQEFYENLFFKGKSFTLLEFMNWYTKKTNLNYFSYPDDCVGFNVPTPSIFECLKQIKDPNTYDENIKNILKLTKTTKKNRHYLIACVKNRKQNDSHALNHELAHALYFTNKKYNKKMNELLKKYESETIFFENLLLVDGYHPSVSKDECQAYFATGILPQHMKIIRENKLNFKFNKHFEEVFKEHSAALEKQIVKLTTANGDV